MGLMHEDPEEPAGTPLPSGPNALVVGLLLAVVALIGAAGIWFMWPAPSGEPPATQAVEPAGPGTPPAPAAAVASPAAPEPSPAPRVARPRARAVQPAEPPPPAAPTTGTLRVEADVAGASVFLDREYKGTAPVTIDGIPPGPHRLNVSAEGYDGQADTIDVAPGEAAITIRFREVRLNESVAVVHKHTVGSCQGRLVADPRGIRYETTNKDDAFVMTHAEIETFEVDYPKKNLRIKRRGGRTYNFTNDSADALFVFHRNVQAARARLARGDPPGPVKH